MRKIPAVMATQHPDNSHPPHWGHAPFISTLHEIEECYHVFSDLECDEYMWDWEGKFVDEAVIDRLFNVYSEYFGKHQLGKEKFLTFRIPNLWNEKGMRVARAFMSIITAAHIAKEYKVHCPPLFEVILPMTTKAEQLLTILKKFNQSILYERSIFEKASIPKNHLEMIPLIEGSVTLMESHKILTQYVKGHQALYGFKPKYLRPFIARSDPALDAGFIPATLSARAAISEYYRFAEESKIHVFPILGVGGGHFRGGLSPYTIERFLELYGGIRTVTLQSAFIYDHPLTTVKAAIHRLKAALPRSRPTRFTNSELKTIFKLSEIFSDQYRPVVQSLATMINDIARYIPRHRERIAHTGHFGYSRKVGSQQVNLPRAITFAGVFYSLGIPPMFIGSGRGLKEIIKRGFEKDFQKFIPGLERDFVTAGFFLNRENLKFLGKKNMAWQAIEKDIAFIEEYLGVKLGPARSEHFIHRNLTSNIYHYWKQAKEKEIPEEILHAARVRRFIG